MREFVTVREFEFRPEAEIAQARLATDGIRSAVRADDEGGLNPGFYRDYAVRLEVAMQDLPDALESLGVETVEVPLGVAVAIRNHAMWAFPAEACGLLLGEAGGAPVFAACLSNAAGGADRFTIDPAEHFGAVNLAEMNGWSVIGAFHSHPRSTALPSESDLGGGSDPAWLQLIIGPVAGRQPELRGYRYDGGRFDEVWIEVAS